MTVELRLLGEVDVSIDGRPLNPGHARQRCVLAVLAVDAGRLVPTDQLIDRVWGDRTPGDARNVLYSYLARLRRALAGAPDVAVQRRPGGYTLAMDPLAVDLHRFRHLFGRATTTADDQEALALLTQAIGLWRGEPFAGLENEWLDTVRTALAAERLAAELEHTDLRLRQGEHTRLLPEVAARAAAHPFDERATGQLMLALHRSGRPADALRHYHDIRKRLVAELGTEPGPDLQTLHQQLLATDPTVAGTTPVPIATPAPAGTSAEVTARQLPAPPGPFTGRDAELARLSEAVITAIGGAGGIGKTWLALHWAYTHVEQFPDGQLFVDLRGFSPDGAPLDPAVALRGFLDALGVPPDRVPVDLQAQAALYRSLLAGKRMLIVLDNAATAEQVVPLLPGADTSTVLVTSRRTLTGLLARYGAHHLTLDTLTDPDAHVMLVRRLGAARIAAEPAATADLIRLCGGFPLALGIIAGRAHAQPHLPLDSLATELRDLGLVALADEDPAASLPAVLSWSVRALSPPAMSLFGLLGVAPGPDIGLPAAAALAGQSAEQVRAVLRELEHASLVQQQVPGRYRLHDLIRLYATDTARHDLAEDVREAALRRVLDFYLHTAHAADRLLDPDHEPVHVGPPAPGVLPQPLPDLPAALAWFDAEHPALLAAQHVAASHAWHWTVWQLAWTLNAFQVRRAHTHDHVAVWRAGLDAAAHFPDPVPGIIACRRLGSAHTDLGRHEEGIEYLRQALALAEKHHVGEQQALTHIVFAWTWGRRRDYQQALAHATRARDLFRALEHPVPKAMVLAQMGFYTARLGVGNTTSTNLFAQLASLP